MYSIVYMRKKFIENQFNQIGGRKGQSNGGDDEQGNPRERERERERERGWKSNKESSKMMKLEFGIDFESKNFCQPRHFSNEILNSLRICLTTGLIVSKWVGVLV